MRDRRVEADPKILAAIAQNADRMQCAAQGSDFKTAALCALEVSQLSEDIKAYSSRDRFIQIAQVYASLAQQQAIKDLTRVLFDKKM